MKDKMKDMKILGTLFFVLNIVACMNMSAMQNEENSLEKKLYAIDKATSFAMTGALALGTSNIMDGKKAICFMLGMCSINVIANTVSFAKQKKRINLLKMTPAVATLIGIVGLRFCENKEDPMEKNRIEDSLVLTAGFGLLSNMAKNICDLWFLFQ